MTDKAVQPIPQLTRCIYVPGPDATQAYAEKGVSQYLEKEIVVAAYATPEPQQS